MEFGKAEEETGVDDETVGLGMIGTAGKVRGEMADAKSKGVYCGPYSTKTADLQPNCREQTKSERRCWAEARLRPMRNPVPRLRCLSRLCRVS